MSIPSLSLEGKVAIVTGARWGIGREIALGFAEAGADVAIADITVEDGLLDDVAERIRKLGRRSLAIQTDIRHKTEVDNLVQRVSDEFGAIDILINNAAVRMMELVHELPEDNWDKVIDTNLKGYLLCCQAVSKKMIEQKTGNIINMASVVGIQVSGPGRGAYDVAKAGTIILTHDLAWELGKYNIRVNALAPNLVKTEFNVERRRDPEYLKRMTDRIPMGRIAETSDIVGPALFLASEASGYITGHTLVVDGGLLA